MKGFYLMTNNSDEKALLKVEEDGQKWELSDESTWDMDDIACLKIFRQLKIATSH